MTIDPKIQQLSKYDFFEYIQQLQILAKKKYSFDIFIENRLSQANSKDIDENIDNICGSGKGLWNEDAQLYVNKSREDDRKF